MKLFFQLFLYPCQPHSIKVRAIHRQALINFGAKTNNSVRYHSVQPSIWLATSLHNARDFISALPIIHVGFFWCDASTARHYHDRSYFPLFYHHEHLGRALFLTANAGTNWGGFIPRRASAWVCFCGGRQTERAATSQSTDTHEWLSALFAPLYLWKKRRRRRNTH